MGLLYMADSNCNYFCNDRYCSHCEMAKNKSVYQKSYLHCISVYRYRYCRCRYCRCRYCRCRLCCARFPQMAHAAHDVGCPAAYTGTLRTADHRVYVFPFLSSKSLTVIVVNFGMDNISKKKSS